MSIARIQKRSEFLFVASNGKTVATKSLLLQTSDFDILQQKYPTRFEDDSSRVGFTVTKKCGSAVVRNRIKRRLRAIVSEIFPKHAITGHSYVLIGKKFAYDREYAALKKDLIYAMHNLGVFKKKNFENHDGSDTNNHN